MMLTGVKTLEGLSVEEGLLGFWRVERVRAGRFHHLIIRHCLVEVVIENLKSRRVFALGGDSCRH